MLNFDKDRFVKIQSGAVAIADDVRALVRKLLDDGLERIFFMGTGGVQFLTQPAIELARNGTVFPVSAAFPAQVVLEAPAGLDERALVILPSLSGTTKESVQLMAFLKERGVKTLSLTGHKNTPLGLDADYNFTNFAEDDTSSESFYLQTLLIVLALLAERGEFADFDATVAELKKLPELLVSVKEDYEAGAAALAQEIKDETYHIFTGAGSSGRKRIITGCASLRKCSGSAHVRFMRPISSTARSNWSSPVSACSSSRVRMPAAH